MKRLKQLKEKLNEPLVVTWAAGHLFVSLRSRVSYFAVFDGHGGARASRFAAEHLHHNLAKKFPTGESPFCFCWESMTLLKCESQRGYFVSGDPENFEKLIKKCLVDTFRQTDEEFLKKASSQ